jgi:hypothetical protein
MDINTVKQGARDAFLVSGNDSRNTRTGFLWVIREAAWAGLHTKDHILFVRQRTER